MFLIIFNFTMSILTFYGLKFVVVKKEKTVEQLITTAIDG